MGFHYSCDFLSVGCLFHCLFVIPWPWWYTICTLLFVKFISLICSFALTINKSQGQIFLLVGIDLKNECFSHGQLYVGWSRVGSPGNQYILLPQNNITLNVVYKEALVWCTNYFTYWYLSKTNITTTWANSYRPIISRVLSP